MVDTQCCESMTIGSHSIEQLTATWQHGNWYEQQDDNLNIIHQHHLGTYNHHTNTYYTYHNKNIIIQIIHQLAFWHILTLWSHHDSGCFYKLPWDHSPQSVSPLMIIHRTWLIQLCHFITHFSTEFQSFCLLGDPQPAEEHPKLPVENWSSRDSNASFMEKKTTEPPRISRQRHGENPWFPVSVVPWSKRLLLLREVFSHTRASCPTATPSGAPRTYHISDE